MAIAAAGIVLAGVVALGARELPGTGTSRRMVAELGWDPRLIFVWLILALFGLAAYVALTTEKGRMERSGKGRRRSSPTAIFIVLAILAVIILLAGRNEGGGDDQTVPALPGEGILALGCRLIALRSIPPIPGRTRGVGRRSCGGSRYCDRRAGTRW